MSKKIVKRVKKTAQEFEESVANAAAAHADEGDADDVLFSLDRTGSKAAKRKVSQELLPKVQKNFISETEKKLVKRVMTQTKKQYAKYVTPIGSDEVRDLWGDVPISNIATSAVERRSKRTKVALPGQSYNPSSTDHQNTVSEAVALQLKRDEALATNSAKVVARKLAALAMDYEEVGAIPLTDELLGGLRTVTPKGVALAQRVTAMRSSGDLPVAERRTRRAHEKPHGARRLAYHAKYKYNV